MIFGLLYAVSLYFVMNSAPIEQLITFQRIDQFILYLSVNLTPPDC